MRISSLKNNLTIIRCIPVLLLLAYAPFLKSQVPKRITDTYDTIDSLVTKSVEKDFGILPAPSFNPSFGTGIAIVPFLIYKIPGVSIETHPSSIQGILMINTRGSVISGIKSTTYLNKNKYWIDAYFGYMNVHLKASDYFEINDRKYTSLYFKGYSSNASLLYNLVPKFYIGPIVNADYLSEIATNEETADSEATEYKWYITPGLKLSYDSRVDIYFPRNAWFIEGTAQWLASKANALGKYQKSTLGISNYRTIKTQKPIIFANRIYSQIGFGDLPLHEKASPGASPVLRGYITGNYMNNSIITYQSELRWMYSARWGVVAFGGVGVLFDQIVNISRADYLPSGGAGLRFKMFKKLSINAALDIAFGGKGNANVYFRMSEAF